MAQGTTSTKPDNGSAHSGDLQEDLAALRKDFAVLAEHVKALASTATHDAKAGIAERGARARDAAQGAAKAAKLQGEAGIAAIENQVQLHPIAAIAIAFGAGMLVSRLTRSSNNEH